MNDDDIWNLILTNNPNGPTVTPFANGVGQGGMGAVSSWPAHNQPPLSAMNLDAGAMLSLMDAGVGSSVIADMLPQLGAGLPSYAAPFTGTSAPPPAAGAAFLSPSALALSPPLQDPTPFALPDMTVDQAAMMYGMSPQQVEALRTGAERQVAAQNIAGDLAVPLVDATMPEFGAFMVGKKLLTGGMDVLNSLNAIQEPQRAANAGDQAIFKNLNDRENQAYRSPNLVGLRSRFPFP